MQRLPSVTLGLVSRFLAAASLLALGSCGSSEPTTPVADRSGESANHTEHQHKDHQRNNADHDGSLMVMQPSGNAMCPLYPDERVDSEYFVLYQGARVGMCCEECTWEWDVLTDEEKKDYMQAMQESTADASDVAHTDAG